MAFDISAWSDYGLAIVSGAAALAGLLFVVVSVNSVALLAGGASLIVGRFSGLYWLAGAHIGALLAGLVNAWVFLLVAGAGRED